ncbi:MAG: OmpA family protein [Phycisphaerae bacterium]|nr:OmpA family protein [Phycisphaerae bacterium]
MASMWKRWTMLTGLAVVGVGVLGGCQDQQVKALTDENTKLREENQQLASTAQTSQAQAQQLQAQLEAERARPAPMGDTGGGRRPGPSPSQDVVIEVAGDVLFGSGSDQLTAAGRKELDKVAATIRSRYASNRIRVEGYTDSDPIKKSKWGTNEALSLARARSVESYLSSKGISSSRIEAVGMGAAKPKATKAQSRRVEIHILGG